MKPFIVRCCRMTRRPKFVQSLIISVKYYLVMTCICSGVIVMYFFFYFFLSVFLVNTEWSVVYGAVSCVNVGLPVSNIRVISARAFVRV